MTFVTGKLPEQINSYQNYPYDLQRALSKHNEYSLSIITGLHKLSTLKSFSFSPEIMLQLENEALHYKTNWNLAFEILGVQDTFVLIKSIQGKLPDKNYKSQLQIINETKKMFGKYITNGNIHVRATINIPSPPEIVDSEWLIDTMYYAGIFLNDLQSATGIDKGTLNDWVSGKIPMNQTVKAMFYYYLLHMMNVSNSSNDS